MLLVKDLGVLTDSSGNSKRRYGKWQCTLCPNTITTTFSKMKGRKHDMCADCARIEAFTIRRETKFLEFITEACNIHKGKYTYSKVKYVNNKTKVIITCPIHGDFEQTPSSHYKHGCVLCHLEDITKTTAQFIQDATDTHGEMYDYSAVYYVNSHTPVSVTCKRCNTSFMQIANDHLNGSGCSLCNTGSDKDLFYMWKIPETNIYKLGVTSKRLGGRRITQVATSLAAAGYKLSRPEVVTTCATSTANVLEKYLHSSYTTRPTTLPNNFDGVTEFRVLTENEAADILKYIKDNYETTTSIQTNKTG